MPRLTPPNTPAPIAAEGYRADVLPVEQAVAFLIDVVKWQRQQPAPRPVPAIVQSHKVATDEVL
jgi:hypothetical protein